MAQAQMDDAAYMAAVRCHVGAEWGQDVVSSATYTLFNVPGRPKIEVTCWRTAGGFCCSTAGVGLLGAEGAEFHIRSRIAAGPEIGRALAAVADFHVSGSPLDIGSSIVLGESIVPGSKLSCGYVTLPYFEGPSFEWLDWRRPGDGRVRFLWLVPISVRERGAKKKVGVEAFESLLEVAQETVDLLDFLRNEFV